MHSEIVKKTYATMHIRLVFSFYLPSPFRQSHPVPEIKQEKEPDKIGFFFFSCGGDEGGVANNVCVIAK